MNIVYIATTRFPDEWANTLQIAKTCEALAHAGAQVELLVPRRHNTPAGDPFAAMGVAPIFTLRRLWCLDLMKWHVPFAFNLMTFTYFLSVSVYLSRTSTDALYLRGEMIIPVAFFWGRTFPTFWETHERPKHFGRYAGVRTRIRGVVTITQYYRQELMREWRLEGERIVCVPDAADIERFVAAAPQREARGALGLPLDRTIALYTGTDLPWKGLAALRGAVAFLPERFLVLFAGDMRADPPDPRARFLGYRPRTEMPLLMAAADILVLTGTATSDSSARYTSPLKLFEYLAAGRPIVASDLPSFREILDESVAYFAAPDDPAALAAALRTAVEDSGRADTAARARALSHQYSWKRRGAHILEFIHTCL